MGRWTAEKRQERLGDLVPRRIRHIPNAPFQASRNHEEFSKAVDMVNYWLLLRLGAAKTTDEVEQVLTDAENYLYPAAFQTYDILGALRLFAEHALKVVTSNALTAEIDRIDRLSQEAKKAFCRWWP
jgi:hypothetical protein